MAEIVKDKVEVPLRAKGFSVGVEIKDSKVTKIYPSSVFLGYVFCNDVLLNVNGKPAKNTAEFFRVVMENAPGKVVIEYEREEQGKTIVKNLGQSRPGFDQLEIELMWKNPGQPLGLIVHRDSTNKVIIAMVESGSAASKCVMAGDILVKVNTTTVNDRDQARQLIVDSITKEKRVKMVLERPQQYENVPTDDNKSKSLAMPGIDPNKSKSYSLEPAVQKSSTVLKSAQLTPGVVPSDTGCVKSLKPQAPSVASPAAAEKEKKSDQNKSVYTPTQYTPTIRPTSSYIPPAPQVVPATFRKDPNADPLLPQDVLDIMNAHRDFYKAMPTEPGILKTSRNDNAPHVVPESLADKAPEQEIAYDPSPKPLKVTPRRVGS